MKLLFIRHGDPNYEKDALTEKGKKEAMLLSNVIDTFGIDDVYQIKADGLDIIGADVDAILAGVEI